MYREPVRSLGNFQSIATKYAIVAEYARTRRNNARDLKWSWPSLQDEAAKIATVYEVLVSGSVWSVAATRKVYGYVVDNQLQR